MFMNIGRNRSIRLPYLKVSNMIQPTRSIYLRAKIEDRRTAVCNIQTEAVIHPALAMHGIRGFEFASMQNLRYSKVSDSVKNHMVIKPGLHLRGYCKNASCTIYNDRFVSNLGFGTFDAAHLGCRCPVCCVLADPIGVGFHKANTYVNGIKLSGKKVRYEDQIFNFFTYETSDGNTLWFQLEITVSELDEKNLHRTNW